MKYTKLLGAASVALMIVIVITLVLAPSAWAQSKYKTLYKFKGGKDGTQPLAGLIFDQAGNLYGTTEFGGAHGGGTAFELMPNQDGSWTKKTLYSFCSLKNCRDGGYPEAGLIFDAAGNLYGTTPAGANRNCSVYFIGCGVVFQLTPNADGSWTENVLHSFNGTDGSYPEAGLIFDLSGNLHGTTYRGGAYDAGTVFRLTPNGNGWSEGVLHSFHNGHKDGRYPSGLIFDQGGNLYGTTSAGGTYDGGTIFQLTPNGNGSWAEGLLHSFDRLGKDGMRPHAGLIFDAAGNLYGTTASGGKGKCEQGCGTVFKLTSNGDGSWTENVLHSFNGTGGSYPYAGLIFDLSGNLYGTTHGGGAYGFGVVFKLTALVDGIWHETLLHTFKDNPGAFPSAALVLDAAGNLYGTTEGHEAAGSVFEITP